MHSSSAVLTPLRTDVLLCDGGNALFENTQRQDTNSFKKRTEKSLGCLLAATGTVTALARMFLGIAMRG